MRERHPYGDYIPRGARAMLIGSFPIAKFTDPKKRGAIKDHEIDFFFGGEKNLLKKILSEIYGVSLKTPKEVKRFLKEQRLGIGDVIVSCNRKGGRSSDSDLYDIEWNKDLMKLIQRRKIEILFFASNSVERWFHRLFPEKSDLNEVTLISPSGQVLRSLVQQENFKRWLKKNPHRRKEDYIMEDYRKKFAVLQSFLR